MSDNPTIRFSTFDVISQDYALRIAETPSVKNLAAIVNTDLADKFGACAHAIHPWNTMRSTPWAGVATTGSIPAFKEPDLWRGAHASMNSLVNVHKGFLAGIDVPHVKLAEVMRERALSTVSGTSYPGLTGVMNPIGSPWGELTALQAKAAKLIDNVALHNPPMASVMSKIASPSGDTAAFQPLVTKVLESYKPPALDMAKIGIAGLNVQSFLESQITAQDILGRTNMSQWSEPLRLAVEYMEMKFPKLLSEEEALSRLGIFKDIDWVVDVAGIEFDELKTGEDLEDFVEEHEEFIEDLVEKFESDEALRIRAAEIFVGPAIWQLTWREVYTLLISTAEYVATQLAALITFGNLEITLILFIVASLRYYNEMCAKSEELEAKHQERIDECVDGLASK